MSQPIPCLRLVLGDQLSPSLSSLSSCNKTQDIILMAEVMTEASYVKHHKQKIAFIFSAMRHFAESLKTQGYTVHYIKLDSPGNSGSLFGEVQRLLHHTPCKKVIVTAPGEYRVQQDLLSWQKRLGVTVEILPDTRFLCTPEAFSDWAKGRKQLRMEYFYRNLRQQYNVLMNGDQPEGGQWNYDADNRKPPKSGLNIPDTYHIEPDTITQEVITLVQQRFSDHFGALTSLHYAVTREQALQALQQFIDERLVSFGDYQDAMLEHQPWMYHAHIGLYLNCGLLLPLECIEAAEQAYRNQGAPLTAVEGFIRQILGWREYVRGIYWLKMPGYDQANFFEAQRNLPEFYWTGDTNMNCLNQCVSQTQQYAYAHHIQRLMVLGNFALLTGIDPAQVNEWFMIVYADAYEWVELPNVSGMALFADGGYLASKPYAAGGAYINKMSDYCKNCRFNVNLKQGPDACPFNYLYWNFLATHREKLSSNHRMAMMYRTYDRMSGDKQRTITADSKKFLEELTSGLIDNTP